MSPDELNDVIYLADGVYVGHDGIQFWLCTQREMGRWESIAMEPDVVEAFNSYAKKIEAKYKSGGQDE